MKVTEKELKTNSKQKLFLRSENTGRGWKGWALVFYQHKLFSIIFQKCLNTTFIYFA